MRKLTKMKNRFHVKSVLKDSNMQVGKYLFLLPNQKSEAIYFIQPEFLLDKLENIIVAINFIVRKSRIHSSFSSERRMASISTNMI